MYSPLRIGKSQHDLGWLPQACHKRALAGFTLAELLIALAILGVIATFTIPKILVAQQAQQNKAVVKEAIGMVSAAYQQAQLAGVVNSNTRLSDLLPYMNYSKLDTALVVDSIPGWAGDTCSGSRPCIILHNGAVLLIEDTYFNGTNTTNCVQFLIDPNGKQDILTTADGPGKSIQFNMYYDGFITTRGQSKPNSCHSGYCNYGGNPVYDPAWFSWN